MSSKRPTKERTLNMISSLGPEDDERTAISKKISWILRRGAKVAGVKMDDEGWVNLQDLLKADVLDGIAETALMQVIVDSNGKKLRYELEETKTGHRIRAYSKADRKARDAVGGGSKPDRNPDGKTLRQEAEAFDPDAPGPQVASPAAAMYAAPPFPGYPGYYPNYAGYPGYSPYHNYSQWAYAAAHAWSQQQAQAHAAHAAQAQAQAQSGMYVGRIKSYNPDKGFGFIDCYRTFEIYQRDVFLHKSYIGDFSVGDVVMFHCEEGKQGMPQAVNVQAYTDFKAKGKGKGKDKDGKGKNKDGKGKGKKGKDGGKVASEKSEKSEKGEKSEKSDKGDAGAESSKEAPKEDDKKDPQPEASSSPPEGGQGKD